MTGFDIAVDVDPPADVGASAVLAALIRSGRFADAAQYYQAVDDPRPVEHAKLLFVAGLAEDAHVVLAGTQLSDDCDPSWLGFLRRVDQVMQGDREFFPDLVSASAAFSDNPFTPLLMLRAAEAARRPQVAAHYASLVREMLPADGEAARAFAMDLLQRGRYIDAVHVLDLAEQFRCPDEPSPLLLVLARVAAPEAFALALIGRFMHREKDPTKPVTDTVRAGRQRWQAAYQPFAPRLRRRRLAWAATLAAAAGVAVAVGNVLPGFLLLLAYLGWTSTRALPGLDLRTSRLVRAVCNPLQLI